MLSKHLTEEQLASLDAGEPDRQTRDHVEECPECRSDLAETRAFRAALRPSAADAGKASRGDLFVHPEVEVLAAYGDGSLLGTEALSVEAHLGDCADCRADVVAMRSTPAQRSAGEQPGKAAIQDLLRRLSLKPDKSPTTVLGHWLVQWANRAEAVFSPMTQAAQWAAWNEESGAGDCEMARMVSPVETGPDVPAALVEVDKAVAMLRDSAERLGDALRSLEENIERMGDPMAQKLSHLVTDRVTDLVRAADHTQASLGSMGQELQERLRTRMDPFLELDVADLQLRLEWPGRQQQNLLVITVTSRDGHPAAGVSLEASDETTGSTVRTTDQAGQALFSLEYGESRIRILHNGVWELRLTRAF